MAFNTPFSDASNGVTTIAPPDVDPGFNMAPQGPISQGDLDNLNAGAKAAGAGAGQLANINRNFAPYVSPGAASQPAAPTLPPAPSAAPGFTIDNFPGVSNSLALQQQGLALDDAALKAGRERSIINYGDSALAGMAGFGLDPQAGAFAQQNYLSGNSTLSRLDKAHKDHAQAIINALAGHGLLNSGDLGYREGEENTNYGNSVFDAQQNVLASLADLANSYAQHRLQLEQGVNDARLNAVNSYLSNPDAYSSLFGTQSPPTSVSTQPKVSTVAPKPKKPADALARYLANAA